ncbi:MAG: hypothetical protein HUU54_13390 [Ignavibacteriaceae bacterium]|nr:hypothetical protein [Ignavibacteriaceae bacterium]
MDANTTTAIFEHFGMDFKPETMFERFFFFTFSQYCTGEKPKITLTKDLIQVLRFALFSAVENYYGAMQKTFNFEKVKEDLPLSEFIKAVEMEMIKNISRGKDMDRTGANSRRLSTFFEECKRVEAQLKNEGDKEPSPSETVKRAILKIKKELPEYAEKISDLLPDTFQTKDNKFNYLYKKWCKLK